jgi:peptidoglycan/xylan/chitin deacetylase (PgdA/CDA1 family)
MTPHAPVTGRLPILTFHAIDDADRSAIAFSPAGFTRLLEILDQAGAGALSLTEAGGLVQRGALFPQRTVVLTFDDGYRSVHEAAFPLLERLGLTATVFVSV